MDGVYLFAVSGIIGTGKSTILKRLSQSGLLQEVVPGARVVIVQEPIKLWREMGWFQQFCSNQSLYAAPFQSIVFCTHVDAVERCIEENKTNNIPLVILAERSMYDQLLFWTQQRDMKHSTTDDMFDTAYMMMWHLRHRFIPPVSGIFFFRTSNIEKTLERVKQRARAEELNASFSSSEDPNSLRSSSINLDTVSSEDEEQSKRDREFRVYEEQLLALHEAWFTQPLAFPPHAPEEGIPCMHVNADAPYHVNDGTVKELAQGMGAFIRGNIHK
jgi:deoxyadenosine/deoxycytidine kinase